VVHGDPVLAIEVGYRAGKAKHAVIRACGQAEPADGALEQQLASAVDPTVCAYRRGPHLRVREGAGLGREPALLPGSCLDDAFADRRARFGRPFIGQLLFAQGGDIDVQVDAVEERSGNA
jgi:hypothetical protein